ncbi:hypothetical protein KUL118_01300 [Tenacibaculum sp. KUL118]|nr:hypothetical protein KUL118_01300 [Tenacibaculum sp. KUL118]
MNRISNFDFELSLSHAGEATDDTTKMKSEIIRVLKETISELEGNVGDSEEFWQKSFNDINGRPFGNAYLNVEEMDWISDWDEWIEHCKEYIKENGFYLEQESTTIYNWDTLAELDETALAEWFSNYTDSAVTNERVCPEARNWGWDSE